MEEPSISRTFKERITELRKRHSPLPRTATDTPKTVGGAALRIGIEMVVAIGLCVSLGLFLDDYWGTAPWAVIVLFFLGAAAGIRNAYRAAWNIVRLQQPPDTPTHNASKHD